MKYKIVQILISIVLTLSASQAPAITDAQYHAVERMGKLNGIALQCGYYDQTRRLKKALISALPKRRQLGQAFETVTNESYMAFLEAGSACQEQAEFSGEVDSAIQLLNQAFGVN